MSLLAEPSGPPRLIIVRKGKGRTSSIETGDFLRVANFLWVFMTCASVIKRAIDRSRDDILNDDRSKTVLR